MSKDKVSQDEVKQLLMDQLDTAAAVLYAACARYGHEYVTLASYGKRKRRRPSLGTFAGEVLGAAERWEEAYARWEEHAFPERSDG